MVNVMKKRCAKCSKSPSFNYEGHTKPLYCEDHAEDTMVNVTHKKCKDNRCKKRASYNYEGKTTPLYCAEHYLDGMIDVAHRKCLECNKIPVFNYEG